MRFCAIFLLLFLSGASACLLYAGDDDAKAKDKDKDKEKKEKPKEPPIKVSAWCPFKDVVAYQVQQSIKRDPKQELTDREKTESRLGSSNWGGFGRRGQWANIVLEMKNYTEETTYRGSATINLNAVNENTAGQIPYRTNYREELEIAPGGPENPPAKQFHMSVLCPEDWAEASRTVMVEINMNGISHTRSVSITNLDAMHQEFIAVVSDSSEFRYLTGKDKQKPASDPSEIDADDKGQMRQVAWVEAKDLPSRWHDLTLANLIIIDGPPQSPSKLSDAQWAALKSYVQAGGNILVTAGKDPAKIKGPVEDLCGIEVRGGTVDLDSLDEIRPAYKPASKDWAISVVDVKVNEDARRNAIIRRNHKTGCVEYCKRFYGAGSVTFLPFSLLDPKLELWNGKKSIPVSIIERGSTSTLFGQMTPEDIENIRTKPVRTMWGVQQPPQVSREALVNLRRTLDQSFSSDTPVQVQKAAAVSSFLLLYLACAVPINYFLFGWFRRREIAWLAVPLWAASFSVGAYVVGYMGQTGRLTVNELTVIEAGPREDVGMARTFFGIYAPRRDEYQLEFPNEKTPKNDFDVQAAPGHLVNVASEDSRSEMPSLSVVDTDSGLNIERLLIQQRSTRRLEIVHRAQLGNGFDIRVKPNAADDKATDIEVVNNTGFDLSCPVYVYQGKAVELNPQGSGDMLKDGVSNKILGVGSPDGVKWQKKDEAFFGKHVLFRTVRGKRAADRTDALKTYLSERVEKFREGVVLAWVERAPLPVKIYDSSHRPVFDSINKVEDSGHFEGLTLLMIPVSVKHGGSSNQTVVQKGPIPVRYSTNYPGNGATWKSFPKSGVAMSQRRTGVPQAIPEQLIELEFSAPQNAAELHNEGCYMRLNLKIEAEESLNESNGLQGVLQSVSGSMAVSIERRSDNGSLDWEQLGEIPIIDVKPGKTVLRLSPVDMPLGDYRIINNNSIHVQLRADISDTHTMHIKEATVQVEDE